MRLSLVVVVAIILQTTSTLLTANASSSPTHHSHSLRGRSDAASKTDTDDHKERVLKKNKNKSGDKKKKGDKKEKGDKKKKKKGEDLDEDDKDEDDEDNNGATPRVGGVDSNASDATGAGAGSEINCAQRTDIDEKDCEKGNEKLAEGSAMLNDFNTFLVECVTSLEAQCAELAAQGQTPAECAGNFGPRCRDEWLQNNN